MSAVTRRVCLLVVLSLFAGAVQAQSIGFSPSAPTSSDAVSAQLSIPFDCTVPGPLSAERDGNAIVLRTVAPTGIVHCPFVPFPEPKTSNYTIDLGTLPAGTYTVTWDIYRMQSSGSDTLQSTASANLVVAQAVIPAGTAVATLPALSTWSMLLLGFACAAVAARRLRRR